MSKFKYTIPTKFGIVTRTSARTYTHVVLVGKMKESVFNSRGYDRPYSDYPNWMLVGYAGRPDLARKLSNPDTWNSSVGCRLKDFEEIVVVEITDDMKREIGKKAV